MEERNGKTLPASQGRGTEELHKKRYRKYRLVSALGRLIELKDPHVARHCSSVARIANAIGREMGLSPRKMQDLEKGALLHDIGKIMVDSSVLNDKNTLTDQELLQIKNHPENGMRILSMFVFEERITDMAWHHHEAWDGSGYPDGLCGTRIPQLTRIVSIADALDAMLEDRPYRKHLTDEQITAEIEKGKGTQFDPQICDIVIYLIRKNKLL